MGGSFLNHSRKAALLPAMLLAVMSFPAATRGDSCMVDLWSNGSAPIPDVVYPNWQRMWAGSFDAWMCLAADGCTGNENITAITVVNFGSAVAGTDIKAVYWKVSCDVANSALYTMTFAGTYALESGDYPAWTWAGMSPLLSSCADLCVSPPCGGYFTIDVYVDIGPCPVPTRTLSMGFSNAAHQISATVWDYEGAITDIAECQVPWYDVAAGSSTILWAYKDGPRFAVPGDTVTYTIYYGKPGTTALSKVVIIDTQPPYTHYVWGSASPAPDPLWDPNLGPPLKLKWTITPVPGNLPTNWGPSNMVTFQLSVDWGNGESFEAGSGNVAAPEGERLNNSAQVFWPDTTCGANTVINPPITTVVRRFLFWKIGDNDVLFSPTYGQPPDEMIYSIFVKNLSSTKTWWDVRLWDTVPPNLDVWCPDCGFEDPCVGWTMTPSGCASASPGQKVSGTQTMLTWKLDMPPGMTLNLRWKGWVKATAMAGETAISRVSILELGHSRIVEGTGHSILPRNFIHLAPIILPTTYISYVAFWASSDSGSCPGFFIDFFPLNKKTQFELRGLEYQATAWPTAGGVSNSIGTLLGDCITGFPGGGGISGGGIAGCKAERVPARYDPVAWHGICPVEPFNFIYKVTSNSPVLWQLLSHIGGWCEDRHLYTPATTLSYAGFMHYTWRNDLDQDSLAIINTGVDPYGSFRADLRTTVHLFQFNYGYLDWDYISTYEIDKESQAYDLQSGVNDLPWRIMSSDGALIINDGAITNSTVCSPYVCCADNHASFMPSRETGAVVSSPGSGNMYGIVNSSSSKNGGNYAIIGNTGTIDAVYRVWLYVPNNALLPASVPAYLRDTGGYWKLQGTDAVPAGLATAGNPDRYNQASWFCCVGSNALFKVEVVEGGPIQVLHGFQTFSTWAGGAVIHSADGSQTGYQFWLHHQDWQENSESVVDVFCSKAGMTIRAQGSAGYTATYTTTGPDQCVLFRSLGGYQNYTFTVLANASQSAAMAQFIQSRITEKGYTAPFLQTGTHYTIILPPVVFVGQNFWITVVVLEQGGTTKKDYAGTTSFTSTDPGAKIQGSGMESYNYTWNACGIDCGVKIFVNVMFNRIGLQTIVAVDTLDGSIAGVAATLVVAADVKLEKRKKLSIAASGDTVQFQICWSNFSSATAFSFTITDAVPMGTSYVPEVASTMLCSASIPVPGMTVYYSTATTTTPPGTFTSVPGTSSPLSNTRWLRWAIRDVYVNSTGCVCFKVSVN